MAADHAGTLQPFIFGLFAQLPEKAVPEVVYYTVTFKDADGTVHNYSNVDLDYYNRVLLNQPNFKLIFSSPEEADAYIAAFKADYFHSGYAGCFSD